MKTDTEGDIYNEKKRVNETYGLLYDRCNGSWKHWGGDYGFRTGFRTGRYGRRDRRQSAAESTIEKKEVEVLPFLEKVKELTFWRLQEKKLSLEIFCTPEDLTKTMDQDLMMSLVMNLVDNAVKASKEGRKIWIRADERELSVRDEGKGIPLEDLARVTEAFYMVDKARARSAGSVGLGLAICEEIAMLHGARLSLESEEGKGTCVHLFY